MNIIKTHSYAIDFDKDLQRDLFHTMCIWGMLDLQDVDIQPCKLFFKIEDKPGIEGQLRQIEAVVRALWLVKYEPNTVMEYTHIRVPNMNQPAYEAMVRVYQYLRDHSSNHPMMRCDWDHNTMTANLLVPKHLVYSITRFLTKES